MIDNFKLYNNAWINVRAPHYCKKIKNEEAKDLLKEGGFLIRNIYNFNKTKSKNFWYIIKSKESWTGIEDLSKKTRKLVRKAHRSLDIRLISKQEMLDYSYNVYESAFLGYTVKSEYMSKEDFDLYILELSDSYEFWGCFIQDTDQLIAFSICHLYDGICEYEMSKADPKYLNDFYPMYGMYFARNAYYLGKNICDYVSSGSRTITEHSGIQDFLIDKFKFDKVYCDIQVIYNKKINLIVSLLYPFRKLITLSLREKNPFLMKVWALLYMEEMQRSQNDY